MPPLPDPCPRFRRHRLPGPQGSRPRHPPTAPRSSRRDRTRRASNQIVRLERMPSHLGRPAWRAPAPPGPSLVVRLVLAVRGGAVPRSRMYLWRSRSTGKAVRSVEIGVVGPPRPLSLALRRLGTLPDVGTHTLQLGPP